MTRCGQSFGKTQFTISTLHKRKVLPSSDSIKILKQTPPEPKSGKRAEIVMIIWFRGKKDILARMLLDSRCTTPIA